jgi:hypothetical protein
LNQIASGSGGQALVVADPADLKAVLLSIGDQLRRQYVLRYTSKLGVDAQPHGLAVQAAFAGQQSTGLKSFTIPTPPTVTVAGLNTSGSISGIQHVTVDVSGGAQLIQLLVENQVVGTARSSPAAFNWDTSLEPSGQRRVIVRVTDMQGGSIEKPFSVTVAAPAPTATAVATPIFIPSSGPVTLPASSPLPAPPIPLGVDSGLLAGVVLLLFLVAATAWYLSRSRAAPVPAVAQALGAVVAATQVRRGQTEVVDPRAVPGGTVMRPGRDRPAPRARLKIVHHNKQSDVDTRDWPITLGRAADRATVVLDDPLVSSAHVRISRDGAQFSIEDLKSRNGTRLNGEPIAPETRRPLKTNDRIYLGDTVVTFVVDSR